MRSRASEASANLKNHYLCMDKIKIAFFDFPGPCNPEAMLKLLRKHFEVIIDEEDPDYVFYSVFGSRYLDFPDAVRIFFTGENVHPDFNLCDYAFGFDWLTLEDRYYRCPNYLLYEEFEGLRSAPIITDPEQVLSEKTRFCNFIYSNAKAHPYREELYHQLNRYKLVDSAGIYLNNTGFTVGSPSLGVNATQDKIDFQRQCKFSIAIENSSSIGYTTEKLVHALAGDTIPIYWGNPEVSREFNTRRFINCHDYDSIEAVVAKIEEIDRDDELYTEMLSECVFTDNMIPPSLLEETLVAHLHHIFSKNDGGARRNRHVWGKIYEDKRREESQQPTFTKWVHYRCCQIRKRSRQSSWAMRLQSLFRRNPFKG